MYKLGKKTKGGKYQSIKVTKGTATRPENKGWQRAILPNILILCIFKEIMRNLKRTHYLTKLIYIQKHLDTLWLVCFKKDKSILYALLNPA
jgi:hypothetical protein